MRHEIAIWQRAAASLSSYSKDEDTVKDTLLKRVRRMLTELKTRMTSPGGSNNDNYKKNLDELRKKVFYFLLFIVAKEKLPHIPLGLKSR